MWTYASRGTARCFDKPFSRFIGTLAYSYNMLIDNYPSFSSPSYPSPHPSTLTTPPPPHAPPTPQKKDQRSKAKIIYKRYNFIRIPFDLTPLSYLAFVTPVLCLFFKLGIPLLATRYTWTIRHIDTLLSPSSSHLTADWFVLSRFRYL